MSAFAVGFATGASLAGPARRTYGMPSRPRLSRANDGAILRAGSGFAAP